MTWQPTHPTWTAATAVQVEDAHWLAYIEYADSSSGWAAGVAAALAWVRGDRSGPVTDRLEQPVTLALATAEMWAASSVGAGAPTPLAAICGGLGVAYARVVVTDPEWADGAWRTLRWLTGTGGQEPPVDLPIRGSGGAVLTADVLVELAVAAAPHREWLPEDRAALRRNAERRAARSLELDARIADARRRLAA